jgi:hypothetical protein
MSDLDQFSPVTPSISDLHESVCNEYGLAYTADTLQEDLHGSSAVVTKILAIQLGGFAQVVHGSYQGYNIEDATKGVHTHSWVNFLGTIVDPLRWVFEGKEPYIFEGEAIGTDYVYDEDVTARAFAFTPPQRVEGSPVPQKFKWSQLTHTFLSTVVFPDGRDITGLTQAEIRFLAHVPFQYLLPHMTEIYQAFIDRGFSDALSQRSLKYHYAIQGEKV